MNRLIASVALLLLVAASACATAPTVATPAPAPTTATLQTAVIVPTVENSPTAQTAPTTAATSTTLAAPTLQNAPTVPASGTAPAAPSGMAQLTIKGNEFSFIAPDQVNSGWTAVTFTNVGTQPHQANLARLQQGKTMQDLAAALQQGVGPALAMLEFVGGPNTIDPGMSQQTLVDLTPGTYVMLCFLPDADGIPHLAKGMIKAMNVVDSGSSTGTQPKADAQATLQDFSFSLPSTVKAGQQVWQVTNNGPQVHELTLAKLAEGKTVQDWTAFMQKPAGQPPFQDIGGIGGISPNHSGYMVLNLQPGNYVVYCAVTDINNGKPHFMEGMIQTLTVQ